MTYLIFFSGVVVGACCGVLAMGLMVMAAESERKIEQAKGRWIRLGDET